MEATEAIDTLTRSGAIEGYAIEPIRPEAFAGVDIVLSSTPASVSRESSPMAAQAGAIVIDNSSVWRMDRDVPLIVHDVKRGKTEVICGQGPAPAKATRKSTPVAPSNPATTSVTAR